MLLAFCISSLPIPIFHLDLSPADNSAAYPCQTCRCGCKTAFQCWTSCCCHTPEERLEWARKNGVTPPSYAILKSPVKTTFVSAKSVSKSSCCNTTKECGDSNIATCDQPQYKACEHCTKAAEKKKNQRWVFVLDALKCQGKSSSFSLLPWTIVPASVTWISTLSISGKVIAPSPILFVDSTHEPATPPPRC